MRTALAPAAVALALQVLPGAAAHAAEPTPPTPGYELVMPATIANGEHFTSTHRAPPGSFVVLVFSFTPGPSPLPPFGISGVGQPMMVLPLYVMPEPGEVAGTCHVCNDELVGHTVYMQLVAGKSLAEKGISNTAAVTFMPGTCGGDYVTFTQGGWGTNCHGNNPGCLRDAHFAQVFGATGLVLGDADGPDADARFAARFTTSAAVAAYLPDGGSAATLSGDLVDPTTTPAKVFGAQLAAAKLNVAFDDAGVFDAQKSHHDKLGDLVFHGCADEDLIGLTVRQVIALADRAISGEFGSCGGGACASADTIDVDGDGTPEVSITDLASALDALNNNYNDGANGGCFEHAH